MRPKILPALTVVIVVLAAACNSNSTTPTPTLASLLVSCDASRLTSFGQQARCTARATLSNGQTEDRTAAAQWSSSDPTKVTVSAGLATAVAPGSADVTAKVDTITAKLTVTVDVGCAFSVSPASAVFGAAGGSQVVNVSASPAGCEPSTWTALSNGPGLTVSPGQGSGSASVTVTAEPNGVQAQARTATIAGQTFTANLGAACTVGFNPAGSDNAGAGAGQRDVAVVVTNGPCRWTAAASDPWITVSQTEGTASTTVRVNYAQNTGGDRTGSVTFSGPDCNPSCRISSMTVFIRQSRPMSTLSLTLEQGEHLGGPWSGYATGPNGFQCTLELSTERIACPPLQVSPGTSVTIVINLTYYPGYPPIFRTSGCDSRTGNSCTMQMTSDRSVTIFVGCATFCSGLEPLEAEELAVGFQARHLLATHAGGMPHAEGRAGHSVVLGRHVVDYALSASRR